MNCNTILQMQNLQVIHLHIFRLLVNTLLSVISESLRQGFPTFNPAASKMEELKCRSYAGETSGGQQKEDGFETAIDQRIKKKKNLRQRKARKVEILGSLLSCLQFLTSQKLWADVRVRVCKNDSFALLSTDHHLNPPSV